MAFRTFMATSARTTTYLRRLMGATVLDRGTYEEIESDPKATFQAGVTVLLSSVAAGVGAVGFGGHPAANVAFAGTVALLAWGAWALVIFEVGVRVMPQPETRSNVGELMRTIGFASAPGVLRVFGILPGVTVPVFALTAVWLLAAMVVAVRQALDYQSTARAVAVCVLGWVLAAVIAIVLGLAFGPTLS
jgi:hypothetical protein